MWDWHGVKASIMLLEQDGVGPKEVSPQSRNKQGCFSIRKRGPFNAPIGTVSFTVI